jgi:anti-anti-sigma factor
MSLLVTVEHTAEGRAQVAVSGRLDGSSYFELDRSLQPLLESRDTTTLVLDLSGVSYISSAGLRSIFKARKALGEREGRLLVVNPQPQVQKVFDIVKAVPVREIFRSVEELDVYLQRIQAKSLDPDHED